MLNCPCISRVISHIKGNKKLFTLKSNDLWRKNWVIPNTMFPRKSFMKAYS